MRAFSLLGGGSLLLMFATSAAAGKAELRDVRIWAGPESTRVVFDLSGSADHQLFTLDNPERIVIDLPAVSRASKLSSVQDGKGLVQRVRSAPKPDGALRVVLDVSNGVKPKSFALTPSGDYGFRLVVDLLGGAATATPALIEAKAEPATRADDAAGAAAILEEKPIVIAVDAGHGGEDPGAKGPHGVLEKNVALAMSRRLAALINAQRGFKAVLVRDGDYYVGLRERMDVARKAQADLFVSVHANAYKSAAARGSAVYALSHRGATSEQARWLASKENAADLIGGVDLADKDDTLAKVLFDISQTSAIEASLDVAARVLSSLGDINRLQRKDVQQAGFLVLKSPDIPSILVETAFITNPEEERRLNDADFQAKFARSIFAGIKSYFDHYRPLRYVAAAESPRNHVVKSGDTLSEVAQLYRVSLNQLRSSNGISSDVLHVGDILQIPVSH